MIRDIIKNKYDAPYLSWKKIPKPVRDMWFGEFQKEFRWLPEYSTRIRSNFERRGATRLRDMFTDIRKSGQRPNWIGEGVWADLSSAWATPEFIKMREQNKQNRASDCGGLGISLHTGGSVPHTEHRRRLDDFLRVRESRQSTGEGSSSGSAHTSEYHTWSEVVGGRQRGRVYGMGSQAFAIEGSSYTSAFHDPSGAEESVNGYNRRQPPVRYRRSNGAVRRSNEPDDARFNRRNTAGTLTGGFPAVTVPAAEPPKDRRMKFRWSPARLTLATKDGGIQRSVVDNGNGWQRPTVDSGGYND
ncbi:hypothetical protein KFK09_005224 [Dendrobium nobile]|uniref:Transposase n=1 Tax=Dendrobium nobile TaxID=94219 RepID=A0A8T3C0A8_DENNO|nr:hypothetical protein KFK09_005224 [Dendrobium nobile]